MPRWLAPHGLVAAALLALSPAALATPMTLQVVEADRTGAPSDPGTEYVQRQLASRGYTTFRIERSRSVGPEVGETAALRVSDTHTLRVRVLEESPGSAKLKVRLLKDGKVGPVDQTVTVREGRPILLRAYGHNGVDVFATVSVD